MVDSVKIGSVDLDVNALTGRFERQLVDVENRARRSGAVMERQFDRAEASTDRLNRTLNNTVSTLGVLAAFTGTAALIESVVSTADSYSLLLSRIRNVITENETLARVERDLFNVAQQNRAGLQETANLYLRLRNSIRELSHEQALGISSTFAQTLVLSGASSQEAAAATLQFAQAMGKARLDGDELRTILEANTRFSRLLADSLGVNVGQLKDLGAAGALTNTVVAKAIEGQSATVETEFQNVELTVGQSMQRLQNAILRYVGQTDQSFGASARLAQGINLVAENVQDLGDALIVLSSGVATGAVLVGFAKMSEAAYMFGSRVTQSLQMIWHDSDPRLKGISKSLNAAVTDMIQSEDALARVNARLAQSIEKVEKARISGNSSASIRGYKGQVTKARAASVAMAKIHQNNVDTFKHLNEQFDNVSKSIKAGTGRIVSSMKSIGGSIIGAFGGPVGAAITAISIAMAVHTARVLEMQRAYRSVKSGMEIVADLVAVNKDRLEDQNSILLSANELQKKNAKATNLQAKAQLALAEARKRELKASLQQALVDARKLKRKAQEEIDTVNVVSALKTGLARRPSREGILDNEARKELDELNNYIPLLEESLAGLESGELEINLGGGSKEAIEELTDIELAIKRFDTAMGSLSKSTQDAKTKSMIVASALKTLAEADLDVARDKLKEVTELLTPRDLNKVGKQFDKLEKEITGRSKTSITFNKTVSQFKTDAERFADAMEIVNKSQEGAAVKSRAALQALLSYGNELKNIPDALSQLDILKDIITQEDAAIARKRFAEIADEAASAFGEEPVVAYNKYADALKKIDEAEKAVKATRDSYNPGQFEAERKKALDEYNQSLDDYHATLNDGFRPHEHLKDLWTEMKTPAEELSEELKELSRLQNHFGEESNAAIPIARKRIELLEEEARQAAYAADALQKLEQLKGTSGLSERELEAARQRIINAAGQGRSEIPFEDRSLGQHAESARDTFATTFRDAAVSAFSDGQVGDAIKQAFAQNMLDVVGQSMLQAGQFLGDQLFMNGGLLSGILGGSGAEDAVKMFANETANAASETGALASIFSGTMTASSLTNASAEEVATASTLTGTLAMNAFVSSVLAATAAMTAMAAQQTGSTVSSALQGLSYAAHGGPQHAGMPVVVGEAGREVFVPSTDGYIVPHSQLNAGAPVANVSGMGDIHMGDVIVQGDASENTLRLIRQENERNAVEFRKMAKGLIQTDKLRGKPKHERK